MKPPDWMALLATFLSCGYPADVFWASTPAEVSAHFRGARERFDREFEAMAWCAWRPGALQYGKKYPSLADFSGLKKQPRRQKTPAEMETLIRTWLRAA